MIADAPRAPVGETALVPAPPAGDPLTTRHLVPVDGGCLLSIQDLDILESSVSVAGIPAGVPRFDLATPHDSTAGDFSLALSPLGLPVP